MEKKAFTQRELEWCLCNPYNETDGEPQKFQYF